MLGLITREGDLIFIDSISISDTDKFIYPFYGTSILVFSNHQSKSIY